MRKYRTSICFCLTFLSYFGFSAPNAPGAIMTRAINLTLDAQSLSEFALDVDQDGSIDFNFQAFFSADPAFLLGFDQTMVAFASQNGVVIDAQLGDGFPSAKLLVPGDVVGPGSLFSSGSFDLGNIFSSDPFQGETGNFGGKRGFLGLRFESGGQFKFGFADIAVNDLNSSTPFDLTIFSVSFEDVAGQAAIVSVPEPSSGWLLGFSCLTTLMFARFRVSAGTPALSNKEYKK